MKTIKQWIEARKQRKEIEARIVADDYLCRLERSARTLSGTAHDTGAETLDIYEIRKILRDELERLA